MFISKNIHDNIIVHTNGDNYYRKISLTKTIELSHADNTKISKILSSISSKNDLDENTLNYEKNLINKIRVNNPDFFDQLGSQINFLIIDTLEYIIKKYNFVIEKGGSVDFEFQKIEKIAIAKNVKYATVYNEIGKQLVNGQAPTIKQIYYASNYLKGNSEAENQQINKFQSVKLSELLMRKMVEWDTVSKILTEKERQYIAEFAYGLKKSTNFHENNIKNHLEKLIASGFNVE